jgi:hypothetical protein
MEGRIDHPLNSNFQAQGRTGLRALAMPGVASWQVGSGHAPRAGAGGAAVPRGGVACGFSARHSCTFSGAGAGAGAGAGRGLSLSPPPLP